MMVRVWVVYFEELFLKVECVFQDEGHSWVFLQHIEVSHEQSQPFNHNLLRKNHHLNHLKSPT